MPEMARDDFLKLTAKIGSVVCEAAAAMAGIATAALAAPATRGRDGSGVV
jgi:hypothetical protein